MAVKLQVPFEAGCRVYPSHSNNISVCSWEVPLLYDSYIFWWTCHLSNKR